MKHARLANERLGDGVGLRNAGQFRIKHAGESEQGVTLVLQRDVHRADASCVPGLALRQFLDEKVEQQAAQ